MIKGIQLWKDKLELLDDSHMEKVEVELFIKETIEYQEQTSNKRNISFHIFQNP